MINEQHVSGVCYLWFHVSVTFYCFKYFTKYNFISGGKLAKNKFCNCLFRPACFVKPGTLNKVPFDLKCLRHKFIYRGGGGGEDESGGIKEII